MLSYLAIAWSRTDTLQSNIAKRLRASIRRARPGWITAVDEPGLYVAYETPVRPEIDCAYPLAGGAGVVLGKLFERAYAETDESIDSAPRDVTFDERVSAQICSDGGQTLSRHYWGQYVAFASDRRTGRSWVLRDPTGQVPCQTRDIQGVKAYFVRLVDLEAVDPSPLTINRHFFIGWAVLGQLMSAETAYAEISTLLPGERVEHSATSATRSFFWSAVEHANTNLTIDQHQAEAETLRRVRGSVHAWACCHDRLVLHLSGGVDSSIVSACLASAPGQRHIVGVHAYNSRSTGDERRFAREIAKRFGFELIEFDCTVPSTLDLAQHRERTVVPEAIEKPSAGLGVTISLNARGYFSEFRGDGGDELFYTRGPLPDAVDYAYYSGLSPRLWSIAMNDARIGRTSVWQVLRHAMWYGLLRQSHEFRSNLHVSRAAIFGEGIEAQTLNDETYWHPLFRDHPDCAPGKLRQAFIILGYSLATHLTPLTTARRAVIQPLLSQPHIEFALQTPLHVLRAGGRDRARARAAFSGIAPSSILNRRYKSVVMESTTTKVRDVIDEGRGLLLDGYLVREGILSRHAVETLLAKKGVKGRAESAVLNSCLRAEAWIRNAVNGMPDSRPIASGEGL